MTVRVDKENTGFSTLNKFATETKHPKFKGIVNVDGKQFHVAVWERESQKTGEKYLSFTFQDEETASKWRKSNEISEDDLPF